MSAPEEHRDDNLPWLGRALLWTDSERNRRLMTIGLGIICLLLLLTDLTGWRYGTFDAEKWFGFYAFIGFVAFAFIIFSTKFLKRLLSRPEDYYGDGAVDSESYPPQDVDIKEHADG